MPDRATLWDFAVRTYARKGIAEHCLRLQDEHGLDVDVVLAALWLAARGRAWDEATLTAALDATETARLRLQGIRSLRRAIGSDRELDPAWQATYERLKEAELAAERVELDLLEAALAEVAPAASDTAPSELALASLRAYAARLPADADSDAPLAHLVALALPDGRLPHRGV